MKDYFKRVKNHPGLGFAFILTLLAILAGASNKSFQHVWQGIIFGLIMSSIWWVIILLTSISKND
jgi:hypothetical protein